MVGYHTRRIALSGVITFCIKEIAMRWLKLVRECDAFAVRKSQVRLSEVPQTLMRRNPASP